MKKLRVTIDGKAYEVLVELLDQDAAVTTAPAAAPLSAAPTTAAIPAPAAASATATPKPAGAAGSDAVVSPLAGKIVSIDVKLGQAVEEGTQVATIEAMKMNTYIYAPKAGKVAEVLVNAGDAVEEGAALVQLA